MKSITKSRLDSYSHGDLSALDTITQQQETESVDFFTEILSQQLLPDETYADAVKRIRKEIGEAPKGLEG